MEREASDTSTTRWLSEREQQDWISYLLATRLLWSRLERDMQRRAGMPLAYYEILSVLSELPEQAIRMSDLSKMLQVSASRLSHAVSRLESSGLVHRQLSPGDRRGWMLGLTDEGLRVVQKAAPTHVESVRKHLFDQLSPCQIEQLGDMSRILLSHLAPGLELTRESVEKSVRGDFEIFSAIDQDDDGGDGQFGD